MGIQNLSRLFNPESIAVIGAGEHPHQTGRILIRNLLESGFQGAVYPVNPDQPTMMNLPAQKTVRDITANVDLAVITSPFNHLPRIIRACADKGVAGAVIINDREAETDDRIALQIKTAVGQSGMRIIGPNGIGIANPTVNLNASHIPAPLIGGRVALLSQSNAVCAWIMDLAQKEKMGFSHVVGLGTMLDVDFADMLDYLGGERGVDSIILYMKNITRVRHFMSAARAVSRIKPIICLKSGQTGESDRSAFFHPGVPGGEDALYDIAFERAGILRVDTFEQLFDLTRTPARQQYPAGRRPAIITNAEGPGAMAVDALSSFDIKPAVLSTQTLDTLDMVLGDSWCRSNPVVLPADVCHDRIVRAVTIAAQASEVDGILVIHSPVHHVTPEKLARELARQIPSLPCPVFTVWPGGPRMDNVRQILNEKAILIYDTPEKAVSAFVGRYRHSRNMNILNQIPVRRDIRLKIDHEQVRSIINARLKADSSRSRLSGADAKKVLKAYGIPVSRTEPERTATPGITFYAGATLDARFGPVIKFGMGGALSRIYQDIALTLPPLNAALAAQAISATKIARALTGQGPFATVNQNLVETLLIRLSRLVTDFPQICDIAINPVVITHGALVALNACILVAPSPVHAPAHLIISPYPAWQERRYTTRENESVLIRPVKPEDAQPMQDFFEKLSDQTVYLRFFTPLKYLSRRMLIQLTQIDYDREVALVALFPAQPEGHIIGSARIIFTASGRDGEFAIMLADTWQGKGVGAALLKSCLTFSKRYGLKRVFGLVLRENRQMLRLADKLGFKKINHDASNEIEIDIDIDTLDPQTL